MTAEKAALRERFRAVRRGRTGVLKASAQIAARVEAVLEDAGASTVHLFWPLPGEVDLRSLAERLRSRGLEVVLPVVVGPRRLEHRRFDGADALEDGPWGLLEPSRTAPVVEPSDLDAVIVPGLAFGRDGTRLGMGGGYYDTFLAKTDALRIGVTFEDALVPTVPVESHDIRVKVVATERETIRP